IDTFGAAKIAHPECGQVAQVAQAALRREGHDFELVFEEVCARGDFEGAAVIFSAADDDERSVDFLIADEDAKVGEIVAENFASALPPVGQNAKARFQVEVERIDDHAVGTGAADAGKVFFLFGLLRGSVPAARNLLDLAASE